MTSILSSSRNIGVTIAVIFVLSKISNISSYTKDPPSSSPEIWLTSYEDTDSYEDTLAEPEFRTLSQFDNQLISKFNQTDYIIQDDIRLVVFTCQAKYPVMWTVPHLKQVGTLPNYMFETVSSRVSDFSQEENPVPTNQLFQSSLTIRFDYVEHFFSVNLTCEETIINKDETKRISSIYLYFTGKHAIENPGTTNQVYVSPSKERDITSFFILPCRPATPNIPILLEKQIDKIKWKRFKYPSKYVKFNPKLGFIMDKNPIGKRSMIFGLYKCTALMEQIEGDIGMDSGQQEKDTNQQQFIYVNVTSVKDPNIIDTENIHFRSNLSLKGNALVKYSQNIFHKSPISPSLNKSLQGYQDAEFVCCSGISDKPPIMILDYCKDPLQCNLLKWSMAINLQANKDNNLAFNSYGQNGNIEGDPKQCRSVFLQNLQVVFCKSENVNFANQLINVFNNELLPVANRLEKKLEEKKDRKINLSAFQAEDSKLDETSRKIFLAIGYPISTLELDEDNGRFYDQVQYLEFGEILFNDIDYDVIPSRELRRRTEKLTKKIAEYPRDHFYVGEHLVPICLGWSYFYSDGAYVGVTFKNGTKQIINLYKEPAKTKLYFAGGVVINGIWVGWNQLVYKFGQKMVAHRDMVSMDCWMPQWNTAIWDKVSRNVTILEPIPPTFQEGGDLEEYAYFNLGDEGKDLEWTVVGGIPESRFDVTKDGRRILKRLTSKLDSEDDESREEDPFEALFNVTLESDNGTTIEDGSGRVTVVKIRFLRKISHEMQGVYECTVENVGGKVRRSFSVIVAEKRKRILPMLLVATIVLSLILIAGMGYRLHRQKKQLQTFRGTLNLSQP